MRITKDSHQKRFGQYWLSVETYLDLFCQTVNERPDLAIVEIGPGQGAITARLAGADRLILAIEKDRHLAHNLRERNLRGVKIVAADALELDWTLGLDRPYQVVGNIPFQITSPLLRKITSLTARPERAVLIVQKEVAERLLAKPGDNERGLLTVLMEAETEIEKIAIVPSRAFKPEPKIEAAILRITLNPSRRQEIFWPLVELAFQNKRQMLRNSLATIFDGRALAIDKLREAGIEPTARPAELSFDDWRRLSLERIKP